MKLEYIVVYENSLNKFEIEHCWIKVKVTGGWIKAKVTGGLETFSPFTTKQTVRSFAQARKFILSMYVHLILILVYKIYM